MREDWVGLKNFDIVCCRGSTVSGVGRGSESIFSSSAPSILGADTCRCWAVKSQRSVFSYSFVSRCYASITNIAALIALNLKKDSRYTVLSSGRSSLKRFRVRLWRCCCGASSITTDGPATTGAKLGVAIADNEALRLRDMVRSCFQS